MLVKIATTAWPQSKSSAISYMLSSLLSDQIAGHQPHSGHLYHLAYHSATLISLFQHFASEDQHKIMEKVHY